MIIIKQSILLSLDSQCFPPSVGLVLGAQRPVSGSHGASDEMELGNWHLLERATLKVRKCLLADECFTLPVACWGRLGSRMERNC